MNSIKKNLSSLLLLPYFIAVTAMLVIDSGDKKIIPFMIISIITSLYLYKKDVLLKNLKSPFIWLVLALCFYTIFSYYYHGASSREMRALIGVTLFLMVFPFQLLTKNVIQWVVLIGSISVFINSMYFDIYLDVIRGTGYINPIPYATVCAMMSMISFSFLVDNSSLKEKFIPAFSFLLSLPPVILSETRGIWLALTLSLITIIIVKCIASPPSSKQMLFALIFTVTLTAFSVLLFKDTVIQRYERTITEINEIKSNDYSTSFGIRLQLWELAPELIKMKPILGHGEEQKKIIKKMLDNSEISRKAAHFAHYHYHNQFLDKWVKSGILGLALIISILIYPLIIMKHLPSLDKYIAISFISLFFIAGLTDVPFNHPQTLILYLLFLAPICSRCKRVSND